MSTTDDYPKDDGLVKRPSHTKRWLSKNFEIQGIMVSAKRRRTYGTSSIGRNRYDAVGRTFYDAIKDKLCNPASNRPAVKYMFNEDNESLFFNTWLRLLFAYLLSFAISFAVGIFLTKIIRVAPETVFELSTKRLSYVVPIFESGKKIGIDQGIILFAWNTLGALVTISFLYTARLFNPDKIELYPQTLRIAFCGRKQMKLLCYLPGCFKIKEESLRRVYVWLMVPWLGMILLGIESGLTVSTSSYTLGSYLIGFVSLAPHGIIEIPAIAFAGAVAFSAHFIVKKKAQENLTGEVFNEVKKYTDEVPLPNIITFVILCLLLAGLVEGHITQGLVTILLK